MEKHFQWLDPDSLWKPLRMQGKLIGWSTSTQQVKYFLFSSLTRVTNLALKITIPAYRNHCFVSPPRETTDTGKIWMITHAVMCEPSKQESSPSSEGWLHPPGSPFRCLLSSCGISHRLLVPTDLPRFPQRLKTPNLQPSAYMPKNNSALQTFSSLFSFQKIIHLNWKLQVNIRDIGKLCCFLSGLFKGK